MCTVRVGSARPRLRSGEVEIALAESSSTIIASEPRSTLASARTRAGVIDTPVGLWARG